MAIRKQKKKEKNRKKELIWHNKSGYGYRDGREGMIVKAERGRARRWPCQSKCLVSTSNNTQPTDFLFEDAHRMCDWAGGCELVLRTIGSALYWTMLI